LDRLAFGDCQVPQLEATGIDDGQAGVHCCPNRRDTKKHRVGAAERREPQRELRDSGSDGPGGRGRAFPTIRT
jgi:hypothetical protein